MEIEEINNNQEQAVDTGATSEEQGNLQPTETLENEVKSEGLEEKPQKTYTQEEVNEKIRNRLDRARRSLYAKYGVDDEYGLDVMHGKANDYDKLTSEMQERTNRYNQLVDTYNNLLEDYSFLVNDIDPAKKEDIKTYFKGKGIDIDADTLKYELATHSDWKKNKIIVNNNFGGLKQDTAQPVNEDDIAKKYFGLNGFIKK